MKRNIVGLLLLIFGLLMILTGVIVNRYQTAYQTDVPIAPEENAGYFVEDVIPASNEQNVFREYVSKKFSPRYFTAKLFDGFGPAADAELEVSYTISGKQGRLLIRTKWMRQYRENIVLNVSVSQLQQYAEYMQTRKDPFFVVIGIGGQPDAPRLLFSVPIQEIKTERVSINDISRFKKEELDRNFFFNLNTKELQ